MAVHVVALPLYTVSVICLLVIYLRDKNRLTEHVIRISGDLKNINPQKYVRLIGIHLALPFQRFGLCRGLLIGCLYWIIALPILLSVTLLFCVPTLYIICRIFCSNQFDFIDTRIVNRQRTDGYQRIDGDDIEEGNRPEVAASARGMATMSPQRHRPDNTEYVTSAHVMNREGKVEARQYGRKASAAVGVPLLLALLSVLALYTECFRFLLFLLVAGAFVATRPTHRVHNRFVVFHNVQFLLIFVVFEGTQTASVLPQVGDDFRRHAGLGLGGVERQRGEKALRQVAGDFQHRGRLASGLFPQLGQR